jgi:hypothetical protein
MIFTLWIHGSQRNSLRTYGTVFKDYRRPRDHPTFWTNPSLIPVGASQTSNDELNLKTLVLLSLYKKVALHRDRDGTNN